MPTLTDIPHIPAELKARLIREYGGETIYIPKRSIDYPALRRALEAGAQPKEISKTHGVSQASVYRTRR